MVRIIDGEIVADGDPRLAQQRPEVPGQPAAASPAGPAAGGTGGHAFSLSAPPLRVLQDAGGTKVVIFGFPIDATHLAMLVAAGVFMGSRGLLFAGVLCEPPPPPGRRRRAITAMHASTLKLTRHRMIS
jgi:hypothetical protein